MENFDLMAKDFDTAERIKRAKAIAGEIRLHVHDGDKKSAIEYGCGTGLVGFQLIDDFREILFVDSSSGMIEQVRQKLSDLEKRTDCAICCDFMTDVPKNIKADYVFSSLVLHHIRDIEIILTRFYDLLHKSGHLLIVDLDADDGSFHAKYPDFDGHNGFEQLNLIEIAKKVGFDKVEAKSFYFDKKKIKGREVPYSLFILDAEK